MSAAIICQQPAEYVPTLSFLAVPAGGTVVNSSVVIDSIAYKKVERSGSSFSYVASQVVPKFGPAWTLTSETPAVCSVSGNNITRISSGKGIIKAIGSQGVALSTQLDFAATASTDYVWTGFSGASKSSVLTSPTLSLLNASKPSNYYQASYPLPAPPTTPFPRNTNCWAAALDLTGSAITTGLGGNVSAANSGALITLRHWLGVRHWGDGNNNMGPGSLLYFADALGNVYSRTVLRRYLHPTKDIIVCLLDADLPGGVKPMKFAGAGMFDFPNKRAYGMGWKINQGKSVSPAIFDHVQSPLAPANAVTTTSASWFDFGEGTAAQLTDSDHILYPFKTLLYQARTGDSGGAIGGYYNGETYLVSLFTGPQGGTLYSSAIAPEINAIIAALDAAQGISTVYQVGVLEIVSGFDPLSLSPAMWLDASDTNTLYDATTGGALVAANGAVARWQDKSGNARHATQATAGARPLRKDAMLNGKPVLRFDGVNDGMAHTLGIVGDNTVFMVARSYQATSDSRVIFSATAPNTALNGTIREDSPSGQWGSFRVEGPRTGGQSLRGAYKIISSQSVGVNGSLTTNGSVTNFTSSGFYTDANARMAIGFNTFNSTEQCNCDIAEILVFPTALSTTDRAAVESYLNAKWAVY